MSEAARFLDGLRRQREKYLEMEAVSAEQSRALAARDMDALLGVVERKRALLAEIAAIDRDIAPFREGWDTMKSGVDAATAKAIEEAVAATRETLKTLLRREDEGRAALEGMRKSSADELQAKLARARARGAYGA